MSLCREKFLQRAFYCSLVATDSGTVDCRCTDRFGSRMSKGNQEPCLIFDLTEVEL